MRVTPHRSQAAASPHDNSPKLPEERPAPGHACAATALRATGAQIDNTYGRRGRVSKVSFFLYVRNSQIYKSKREKRFLLPRGF